MRTRFRPSDLILTDLSINIILDRRKTTRVPVPKTASFPRVLSFPESISNPFTERLQMRESFLDKECTVDDCATQNPGGDSKRLGIRPGRNADQKTARKNAISPLLFAHDVHNSAKKNLFFSDDGFGLVRSDEKSRLTEGWAALTTLVLDANYIMIHTLPENVQATISSRYPGTAIPGQCDKDS